MFGENRNKVDNSRDILNKNDNNSFNLIRLQMMYLN